MSGKNIEALTPILKDAAECLKCNMSANNLADSTLLKELPNLIHLDLSGNKIKNVAVFT